MPDAEGAIERLYEDADIRDELRDDEANLLLKWAEDRLTSLAEQSATDEEFDAKATQFRGLLKGMNRLVGSRATLDAGALDARLAELSSQAASVTSGGQFTAQAAPSVPTEQLKDIAGKLPQLDDAGAVNALTALFTPGAARAPTAAAQTAAPEAPTVSAQTAAPAPAAQPASAGHAPRAAGHAPHTANTAPAEAPTPVTSASAQTQNETPVRGKPHVSAPTSIPVSAVAPAPQPPPVEAYVPDAEDDGGLLHRFSIHFWPHRKKTPPQ